MTRIRGGITARRFIEALHADGFELRRIRGSRRICRYPDGRRAVVAPHSLQSDFPIGTLKSMIQDAGWTKADLVRLGLADEQFGASGLLPKATGTSVHFALRAAGQTSQSPSADFRKIGL